jgi:hypothetical protein
MHRENIVKAQWHIGNGLFPVKPLGHMEIASIRKSPKPNILNLTKVRMKV